MTGYYALISDGIAALDKKTSEARREYYDRARANLADRLEKADPPWYDWLRLGGVIFFGTLTMLSISSRK